MRVIAALYARRCWRALPRALLLILPMVVLGQAGWLAWQEGGRRSATAIAPPEPVPAAEPVAFQGQAIAAVLGLAEQAEVQGGGVVLKATVASHGGQPAALMAHAGTEQWYRVGDALPGGARLRRVEAGRVVLWQDNREQRLGLQPATVWLSAAMPAVNNPPVHLWPTAAPVSSPP